MRAYERARQRRNATPERAANVAAAVEAIALCEATPGLWRRLFALTAGDQEHRTVHWVHVTRALRARQAAASVTCDNPSYRG